MRKLKVSNNIQDSTKILNLISLAETKKLTFEEEKKLFIKLQNGENEVIDKILDSWEVIIISVAKQYLNKGISIQELINVGKDGLKRQIVKDLDITKTHRSGAWWIQQSILTKIDLKSNK